MVVLESFRIKNYKSIKDSGVCYLDNFITVLAGKNEAGKTAILEALEDFTANKSIRDDAIPLWNEKTKPEIELTIRLEKEDIVEIIKKFNLKGVNIKELPVQISKVYRSEYKIDCSGIIKTFFPKKEKLERNLLYLIEELKEKVTNLPVDKDYVKNKPYHTPGTDEFNNLEFVEGLSQSEINKLNIKIEKLKGYVKEFNKIKKSEVDFEDFLKKNFITNFILFKSFEDNLLNQIAISQAQNDPLVKDLALISNLDFSLIQPGTDPRKREKHRQEVNIKFSKNYEQFWTQDHSHLS